MPAAALLAAAVAVLVRQEARARPWRAAIGFGVMLGLAAYVRAVALPLALLAFPYWVAAAPTRAGLKAAVARTALGCGVAALVLLPWGIRNQLRYGEFFITDSHGGHTALVGANPDTDGVYSRSLNQMFWLGTGLSPVRSEAARCGPRGVRAGEVLGARSSRRTRRAGRRQGRSAARPTNARCCTGRSIARACCAIRRARSSIATAPASSGSSMVSGTCWPRRRSRGSWSRRRAASGARWRCCPSRSR